MKDAAVVWYKSLVSIVQDLVDLKSKLNPTVFYWRDERGFWGVMCSHVDDLNYGGNKKFEEEVLRRLRKGLEI